MNRLIRFMRYVQFAESTRKHEGAFGCDCDSMLLELEAERALQKPNRKKRNETIWGGPWQW